MRPSLILFGSGPKCSSILRWVLNSGFRVNTSYWLLSRYFSITVSVLSPNMSLSCQYLIYGVAWRA